MRKRAARLTPVVSHDVTRDRFSLNRALLLFFISLLVFVLLRNPSRRTGNPGTSHRCSSDSLDRWRDSLFERLMTSVKNTELRSGKAGDPAWPKRFSVFEPIASCSTGAVEKVGGDDDGSKLMCLSSLKETTSCLIVSLGSAGQYEFEEAMLKATACKILTLDCSYAGTSLHPRHTYLKKCLGSEGRMEANPMDWITLPALVEEYGRIDFLKMDIEGYEFDVLATWSSHEALPKQLVVEVHGENLYYGTSSFRNPSSGENLLWPLHSMGQSDMGLFMVHLANLGYAIVAKEDNPLCAWCSEVLLERQC